MKAIIHGHEINFQFHEDFWQSAAEGKWEAHSFDVLNHFLEPGKLFIDIGAWNGILSLYALKLGAKVIPFEPDPVAFHILQNNLRLNGSEPIARPIAISSENGEKMLRNTTDGWGNSVSSLISGGPEVFIVPARTFSDEIHPSLWPSIGLIKMDIEGEEVNVIPQMHDWIKKVKPNMYISFHPGWFPNGTDDALMIVRTLWPTHACTAVMDGNKDYSHDDFLLAMKSPHNHSFVFTPR